MLALWHSKKLFVFVYSRVTTIAMAYLCRPASLQIHSLSWLVSPWNYLTKNLCYFGNMQYCLGSVCVCVWRWAGSEDGRVHVWSTESGMKVAVLDGKHSGPINTLQFNPRYMTFASACTNMVRSRITQTLRYAVGAQIEKIWQLFLCYCVVISRRFGYRVWMTCDELWCCDVNQQRNHSVCCARPVDRQF